MLIAFKSTLSFASSLSTVYISSVCLSSHWLCVNTHNSIWLIIIVIMRQESQSVGTWHLFCWNRSINIFVSPCTQLCGGACVPRVCLLPTDFRCCDQLSTCRVFGCQVNIVRNYLAPHQNHIKLPITCDNDASQTLFTNILNIHIQNIYFNILIFSAPIFSFAEFSMFTLNLQLSTSFVFSCLLWRTIKP